MGRLNLSYSNHELWSGSDDPEELAYHNKIKKEMDDMKKRTILKMNTP